MIEGICMTIAYHFLAVIRIAMMVIRRTGQRERKSDPGQGRAGASGGGWAIRALHSIYQEEANCTYHDLLILIDSAASPAIK
jgi:hypothetical protein